MTLSNLSNTASSNSRYASAETSRADGRGRADIASGVGMIESSMKRS
eukprot:CAMPEP_0182468302 /NCGR_PEP_ID=MMETSP1319-20130603/15281_1 /TAXON_ID=172717 /ORGANISM="Bolidomonas pacifica, Strain RCC208" /LENGTH=46 /DNA_ID= /DNA_START= /DNA_END= /DNA_ORIENTATION=